MLGENSGDGNADDIEISLEEHERIVAELNEEFDKTKDSLNEQIRVAEVRGMDLVRENTKLRNDAQKRPLEFKNREREVGYIMSIF